MGTKQGVNKMVTEKLEILKLNDKEFIVKMLDTGDLQLAEYRNILSFLYAVKCRDSFQILTSLAQFGAGASLLVKGE